MRYYAILSVIQHIFTEHYHVLCTVMGNKTDRNLCPCRTHIQLEKTVKKNK